MAALGDAAAQERPMADDRFRLMFERSADAILLLDAGSNNFVEYNPATLAMLRCTREELMALHPSELSPASQPDGRDSFEKANAMIATAVARGSHRFEWMHCSPHREDFPVEVLLTPIVAGPAPMLLVVWRDITERKRSEQALRETQKLESLGMLAGGIAHDFNNLLTAIMGHLSLVGTQLGDPGAAHLEQALQAAHRAAHLTRQMLAYSGRGTFVVKPINLSIAVREMLELLAVNIPRSVVMDCRLEDQLPAVQADAAQLQQVIMNLVTNAAEAIGERGTITVRTHTVCLDAQTIATVYSGQPLVPGVYVSLEVEDTGSGMTPEVMARIFDPFFSTKRPGRGLGLCALQGIIRSHRGGIHLRSQPGGGTTFRVVFPASAVPVTVEPAPPRVLGSGRGLVLLVEDEEPVRKCARVMLQRLGFESLEAADGEAALELFRGRRSEVTWVLMDISMPGMDGVTAYERLALLDPQVKVVLMSGWAESDVAARCRQRQPAGFLSKPFRSSDRAEAARRVGVLGA
jgi:two-component system cell cycle sensor histidine kinase/response regulator CckA